MSSQIVKRQILLAADALNLPTATVPSKRRLSDACNAAKLLRNRLLREHIRVVENVEKIRQANMYDEDSVGDDDDDVDREAGADFPRETATSLESAARHASIAREEFLLVAELMLIEKVVLPVLYAHGMNFHDTLLLQLLKLIAVVLMPAPRFSRDEVKQSDALVRIKKRCGCDEFCALLIQSLAPVTEKRARGAVTRDDFVLLEISLTILARLLDGMSHDIADAVGAFCRNHGFEFLLVVTNQNFVKLTSEEAAKLGGEQTKKTAASVMGGDNENEKKRARAEATQESLALSASSTVAAVISGEKNSEPGVTEKNADEASAEARNRNCVCIDDDENESDKAGSSEGEGDEEGEQQAGLTLELEEDFRISVNKILESKRQLQKLNNVILSIFSSILRCMPACEIAELRAASAQMSGGKIAAVGGASPLRSSEQHFRDCVRERQNWRYVARNRNGAINSNAIIVKVDHNGDRRVAGEGTAEASGVKDGGGGPVLCAVGSVSSLMSTRRKDPLQILKDMDLRKRGRFVKGMYQNYTAQSDLPLPVKLKLSELVHSFIRIGFEPLAAISWPYLVEGARTIELATLEYKELVAGYKNSSERMEMTSPFNGDMYNTISSGLQFMSICSTVLRLNRELVSQPPKSTSSEAARANVGVPELDEAQQMERRQQWQSVLHIITLEHCNFGFSVLRAFMTCADLRKRLDVCVVVTFLAEIFLTLFLLIDGATLDNPSVCAAAHALAATALYTEENTKIMFELIGEYVSRAMPIVKAQACTLFVFSMFQLMERCSYRGYMIQPVQRNRRTRRGRNKAGSHGESAAHTDTTPKVVMDEADDYALSTDDPSQTHPGLSIAKAANQSYAGEARTAEMSSADGENGTNQVPSFLSDQLLGVNAQGDKPLPGVHVHGDDELSTNSEDDSGGSEDEEEYEERCAATTMVETGSVASSSYSTRTTDREVAVSSYLRRIATTRSIGLLYSTFCHWRINDADVNLSLTYIMEALMRNGCVGVLYNVGFLLLMRDVLTYGKETHPPLYRVCDQIVYEFFNPAFAQNMDQRAAASCDLTVPELSRKVQSFHSLEVALRCSRALFNFSATDYTLLEEKAMPHLMDCTMQELAPSPTQRSVSPLSDDVHTDARVGDEEQDSSNSDEEAAEGMRNYDRRMDMETTASHALRGELDDHADSMAKHKSTTISRKRHRADGTSSRRTKQGSRTNTRSRKENIDIDETA